jgi:hypothetical protein
LLLMNLSACKPRGLYLEAHIDVEVSNSEDDRPKLGAPVGQKKKFSGDNTEDGGVTSAEPIAPNPISFGTPE